MMITGPTPAPPAPKGMKTVSFTARIGGKKAKTATRPLGGGR